MVNWEIVIYTIGALATTYIAFFVCNKVLALYHKHVVHRTKTKFDDEFIPLIKRVLGIIIWAIGLGHILLHYGIDERILSVIVGGITAGFMLCVKRAIADILGGITIMFDKPFRVGDTVKLSSGEIGEVINIGVRRTYIRVKDKRKRGILIHTNSALKNMRIINFTYAEEGKYENPGAKS